MAATFPHLQENNIKNRTLVSLFDHYSRKTRIWVDSATAKGRWHITHFANFCLVIHFKLNSSLCPIPVTVVRCWPHSKDCLIKMPLVSLHYQLMSSADQINVIRCIKLNKGKSKLFINMVHNISFMHLEHHVCISTLSASFSYHVKSVSSNLCWSITS